MKRMRPRTRNEATSPQKKGGNARLEIVGVYNFEKRKKRKRATRKKEKKRIQNRKKKKTKEKREKQREW